MTIVHFHWIGRQQENVQSKIIIYRLNLLKYCNHYLTIVINILAHQLSRHMHSCCRHTRIYTELKKEVLNQDFLTKGKHAHAITYIKGPYSYTQYALSRAYWIYSECIHIFTYWARSSLLAKNMNKCIHSFLVRWQKGQDNLIHCI